MVLTVHGVSVTEKAAQTNDGSVIILSAMPMSRGGLRTATMRAISY